MAKSPVSIRLTNTISFTVPSSKYLICNFISSGPGDALFMDPSLQITPGGVTPSYAANGLVFTAGKTLRAGSGSYLSGFLFDVPALPRKTAVCQHFNAISDTWTVPTGKHFIGNFFAPNASSSLITDPGGEGITTGVLGERAQGITLTSNKTVKVGSSSGKGFLCGFLYDN